MRYLSDIALTAQDVDKSSSLEIKDYILKNADYVWNNAMKEGYRIADDWIDLNDYHNDAGSQTSGVDLLISALLVSEIN